MAWNTDLEGTTLRIAQTEESPLRVMAGPGTGKSFALKRRVARLLESGADPRRILAVTFTRNAAANLVKDLHELGVRGCENIVARTLHGYCYTILAKQNVLDFLNRVPRPIIPVYKSGILQFEGAPLLQDLSTDNAFGNKREKTKRIRAFEAAWARLQEDEPGWALDPTDQSFHDLLIEWLIFHEAILIGELVPLALRYLRENPASSERTNFDHVLVDEYQDLNKAEQVLLDLVSENCNLSLVGDVDQSIYSFRYAHPEGIISFHKSHPETHDESLDECRRCPKLVVTLADNLIRHNYPPGCSRRLNTFSTNPVGEVSIVQWNSLEEEAKGITKYCGHLISNRGYRPEDILILTSRRLIGYGIRDSLIGSGINTHSFYHEESLEALEAQERFSLLTLLSDSNDRVALRYWLGYGSPSWRAREYHNLRTHCETTTSSPFDLLERLSRRDISIPRTKQLIDRFNLLKEELEKLNGLVGNALIDALFPAGLDWNRTIREAATAKVDDNTEPAELLDILRNQITQPEMPEEGNYIRVMSLHKSKGLTSKVVIVAGCNQGLIPTINSALTPAERQKNLKEQRRLFYVSITRCKQILLLSSITHMKSKVAHKIRAKVVGQWTNVTAITSQFIHELGPNAPQSQNGDTWIANGF